MASKINPDLATRDGRFSMMRGDFLSQPVELAATSPRLDMIQARLKLASMRPYAFLGDMVAHDPLLIDTASASPDQLRKLSNAIGTGTTRPVILLGAPAGSFVNDAILVSRDSDLDSVPARLASFLRRRERASEAKLRAATLAELGYPTGSIPDDAANFGLLFVTGASPHFAALKTALSKEGIDCSAALTALTAREHLLGTRQTAIVLDVAHSPKLASEMAGILSDDPAFASHPVYVLGKAGEADAAAWPELADLAAAWLDANTSLETLANRLTSQVSRFKSTIPAGPEVSNDPAIRDSVTGLFSRHFFTTHLDAQIRELAGVPVPLSLIVFQDGHSGTQDNETRQTLPTMASAIMARSRDVDCIARLDWSSIGLSLRGTGFAGARRFAERVVASIGTNTKIDAAVAGRVTWRIAEKRNYHKADTLIRTAMSAPPMRLMSGDVPSLKASGVT